MSSSAGSGGPAASIPQEDHAKEVIRLKKLLIILKKKYEDTLQAGSKAISADDLQAVKDERDQYKALLAKQEEMYGSLERELEKTRQEAIESESAYQNAKAQLDDVQALQDQLASLREIAAQAQQAAKDAEPQISAEEFQDLQRSLNESQEQLLRQKVRLDKLAGVIQEKEKRIHDLQQFEFSHKKLLEQKQQLQVINDELQKRTDQHEQELTELRQHASQLERVIKFLREKSEEQHLTANQFKDDFEAAQESNNSLREELKQHHAQHNQLKTHALQLEKEKQDIEEELKAIQEQFEHLRNAAWESEEKAKQIEDERTRYHEALEEEKIKSRHLAQELHSSITAFTHLEGEVNVLKQTLSKVLREVKELEGRYYQSVQEKVAALSKYHQAHQLIDRKTKELNELHEELEQALEDAKQKESDFHLRLSQIEAEHLEQLAEKQKQVDELLPLREEVSNLHIEKEELTTMFNELQSKLQEADRRQEYQLQEKSHLEAEIQKLTERYQHRDQEIALIEEQLTQLKVQHHHLQEECQKAQTDNDEKDAHIKMAQQHLAKKVKECTQLAEKVDEQKVMINELQAQQAVSKAKLTDLQESLERLTQQERRLQEQLQDTTQSCDAQVKKWEEKYFALVDKWQVADSRNKELEQLENKHKQMQAMFANLGSFLTVPNAALPTIEQPKPQVAPVEERVEHSNQPESVQEEPQAQKVEITKPYHNLFEMPKSQGKPRQNLFE